MIIFGNFKHIRHIYPQVCYLIIKVSLIIPKVYFINKE